MILRPIPAFPKMIYVLFGKGQAKKKKNDNTPRPMIYKLLRRDSNTHRQYSLFLETHNAEKFDSMRSINLKLHPKKYISYGVSHGVAHDAPYGE